jgi:hypothetical protein
MGTEILDFDRAPEPGGDKQPPSPAVGESPTGPEFVEDLDDVAEGATGTDGTGSARPVPIRRRVALALERVRGDRRRQRHLLEAVAAGLVLVLATTFIANHQADRKAEVAAQARLAVDLRVDQLPELDPRTGPDVTIGVGSITVKLHNLGERDVRFTALLYRSEGEPAPGRTLLDTDVTVRPDRVMDRAFPVTLPCGRRPAPAIPGPGTLIGLVETADGQTHVVPVDVSALDVFGGLLSPCRLYAQLAGEYDANSQIVGNGVRITLTMPVVELVGANYLEVDVQRDGVPSVIGFTTTPKLPERARAGTRISILVRPVVSRCPARFDPTAALALGLRIGSDTYPDPYLPLQVAREVGRVCADAARGG